MAIVLNGTTGVTTPSIDAAAGNADLNTLSVAGNEISAVNSLGFRNRIINGGMTIDQRNAGASVTITNTSAVTYTLDRQLAFASQASKFSVQQNAGSITPPTGFSTYLGITSLSAYSVTSTDIFEFGQRIEGFNTADLAWGTASAATVTLSFWVRSSLTGTFGGAFRNSAGNRCYPFIYTISNANTWEQKTVTVAGDTSGTWVGATNGVGLEIAFGLGVGSTYSGTAGAWAGSNFVSATGATSVVGTNGATFYITGVQLEAGAVATPFERVDYGRQLIMCQRYYQLGGGGNGRLYGYVYNSTIVNVIYNAPVQLRAPPAITLSTTSMVIENVPWASAVTGSGCTANAGHASLLAFDFQITGFSGLTGGQSQPITVPSGVYFSAEL